MSDNRGVGQALVFYLLFSFFSFAHAAVSIDVLCDQKDQIPDEWIVRWKPQSSFVQQKSERTFSLESLKNLNPSRSRSMQMKASSVQTEVSRLNTMSPEDLLQLSEDPRVLSIESNCRVHLMSLPNDPDWLKNIGHQIIRMPQAWNYTRETPAIVAIPDTGIEINHPDLAANMWRNEKEFSGLAGVDDDQNGYVDDIYGWNFAEENNDISPGTYSGADHGTHVAGILGAAGNNGIGGTGIAWKIKLMALRPFQKSQEVASSADLIESINYAVRNGAQIINCSWGSERASSQAELEAFRNAEAAGVLIVAASGNESVDSALFSPAGAPSVFAVGSVNSFKELSSFSSFGNKIGVLAPGGDLPGAFGIGRDEGIYSTLTNASYGSRRGTSMSAPFVSGVAALVKSFLPKLKPAEMRKLISESGDRYSLRSQGQTYTYSVLNAEKALAAAAEVSKTQPNCAENCIASGSYSGNNTPLDSASRFGGGCALTPNSKSAGAGQSPWDLAFLVSFFWPVLYRLRKKKKPNSAK